MGKIFCLMGKSASGKDTVYQELVKNQALHVKTIVPYTTRPKRDGEADGREYFFFTAEKLSELKEAGKIIELREYHTVHGIWSYFTADDGQIDLSANDYLLIGTLESYQKMRDYFGKEALVPIYIETEDGLRLQRALDRERSQKEPKYAEMCRRFLADEQDFSPENLEKMGITKVFENKDKDRTLQEIEAYILSKTQE